SYFPGLGLLKVVGLVIFVWNKRMSPKRAARLLAGAGVAALAIIAVVGVVVIRGHQRQQILRQGLALVPGSLLHAKNFHWTQMKGDEKQWELVAGDASYS